jgi:hypothetical protein
MPGPVKRSSFEEQAIRLGKEFMQFMSRSSGSPTKARWRFARCSTPRAAVAPDARLVESGNSGHPEDDRCPANLKNTRSPTAAMRPIRQPSVSRGFVHSAAIGTVELTL